MQVIILAGGKGSRLSNITKNIPKPLMKIENKPVLQYQIENLSKFKINNIILTVGYKKNDIKKYFQDGSKFNVKIDYFEEDSPLGTAGAFYFLKDILEEEFLIIHGDLIFDVNFKKFIDFHKKNKAICSLMVHPNDHPYDSDVLILDDKNRVKNMLLKNKKRDVYYNNIVNAGIIICNKKAILKIKKNQKQDLEKDIIRPLISTERVFGYKTSEYIKDMGTEDRYNVVKTHIRKNTVSKKNLRYKQKAIFLDRDGTINRHIGLISKPHDLEIYENAYEAISLINQSDYLAIVITNQPVVARNLCSIDGVEEIHRKMEVDLGNKKTYIDDIFYCPHHPDKGYPEENPLFKIKCNCRKPNIGLIEKAIKKYNIDITKSFFIGDSVIDIQAGKKASLKTIFLGKKNIEEKADYFAKTLLEAIKIIL